MVIGSSGRGLLPGQQRQGQRVATSEASELVRDSLKVSSQGRCGQQYGRRIEAEEHARGVRDTPAGREVEVQRIQVADHGGDADPGPPSRRAPASGRPATATGLADVAEQGQDGEFLPGDAQHAVRCRLPELLARGSWGAEPAAEQDGEGEEPSR